MSWCHQSTPPVLALAPSPATPHFAPAVPRTPHLSLTSLPGACCSRVVSPDGQQCAARQLLDVDFLCDLLPSGFLSDIRVMQNTQEHLFPYSHLCRRETRPCHVLPARAGPSFATVLAMLARPSLHPLNLMLADLGKTLHFPSVLHTSCWAGCPPMSPPQLSHAASAVPGGPCPCPPTFPSLVCARGASFTGTALAHMQRASATLQPCASLRIPHILLTFLPAETTFQARVTPAGDCSGPWSRPPLGKVGSDQGKNGESWTCSCRAAL